MFALRYFALDRFRLTARVIGGATMIAAAVAACGAASAFAAPAAAASAAEAAVLVPAALQATGDPGGNSELRNRIDSADALVIAGEKLHAVCCGNSTRRMAIRRYGRHTRRRPTRSSPR